MTSRGININDINRLREIHQEYFKDEFPFPEFMNGFNCSFLIENNDEIIVAGGIRPIAEVVLLTNKSLSTRIRMDGLKEFLNVSKYIGERFNYSSLHAFVQDDVWKRHLINSGFRPSKGESILYHL